MGVEHVWPGVGGLQLDLMQASGPGTQEPRMDHQPSLSAGALEPGRVTGPHLRGWPLFSSRLVPLRAGA